MECSSRNSRRGARCHLSGMDLTRQRLVMFPRGGMYAAVLRDNSCEISSDYSAARETYLDSLRFVAGFWLFIGTANDRPNMSL